MPGVTPQTMCFEQLRTFKFSIPKLQRNYVWDDENIDRLIASINELDNDESKFLGSFIHFQTQLNQYDIIDGQQRSATMTIFAKAIVDLYHIWKELNDDPNLANSVSDHEIDVFGNQGTLHWHFENLFHYWCKRVAGTARGFVTMKGKDGERYKYIMANKRTVADLADKKYEFTNKPAGQGPPRIYKAYQKIFKYFAKGKTPTSDNNRLIWYDADNRVWACSRDENEVIRILSSCLNFVHNAFNKAYFVQLIVNDRRDIYDIFDAVNGTGVKLTEYDLLRNQLAGMIDSCGNLQDAQKVVFEAQLAAIVDDNDYKHAICQSVMDVVPYAITGKTKKSEKADFWNQFADKFTDEDTIEAGIEELNKWFGVINNLQTQPENFVSLNPALGRKLQYFSSTNSKFHLAPLFKAYLEHESYDSLVPILVVCEVLFINYIIIDREYPQEVKNMVTKTLNGEVPIDWENFPEVIALDMWTALIPERTDVSEQLASHAEYSNGQSKFLLWNVNERMLEEENARLNNLQVPQGIQEVVYSKDWTLEHILPQKAKIADWVQYAVGTDLHSQNVNKIGNHTLYKKRGNIQMGNKSWAFKKENLPYPAGVFPGMRLNIEIFDGINQWGETEISARSSELAEKIEAIWFG